MANTEQVYIEARSSKSEYRYGVWSNGTIVDDCLSLSNAVRLANKELMLETLKETYEL